LTLSLFLFISSLLVGFAGEIKKIKPPSTSGLATPEETIWVGGSLERVKGKVQMNKAQLIEAVASAANVTKADAENVLNATLESIKKTVKKGEDVTLIGFGTFTVSKRQARAGRNPQTGKEIEIPAMTVPKFRPGREFKDAVK
jgi:DNA-binding protein HU-beta